jgi:uncharacterized protein with PIN domain
VDLQASGRHVDTLAWYARLLGETDSARYRDALNLAKQRYTNKKIIARVDEALKRLGTKQAEQYAFQEIDRAGLRTDAQRAVTAQIKSDRQAFSAVRPKGRLSDVLEALGAPDEVTLTTVVIARYGRSTHLLAHYAGAGMVAFQYDFSHSLGWSVIETMDELIPVKEFYTGTQFGMAQSIATLRGESYRLYLHGNARKILRDPTAKTVLIQRILAVPFPADRYEDDANAVAIKRLGRSRDAAMREPIEKIAATAKGKDTAKMAKNYAEAYAIWDSKGMLRSTGTPLPDERDTDDAGDLDESKPDADAPL